MEKYNDTQIAAFKEEFDNFLTIAKEKSSAVQVRGNRDNNFSEFLPTSSVYHTGRSQRRGLAE